MDIPTCWAMEPGISMSLYVAYADLVQKYTALRQMVMSRYGKGTSQVGCPHTYDVSLMYEQCLANPGIVDIPALRNIKLLKGHYLNMKYHSNQYCYA